MTLFLALGLVGVVSVSTLFATEQLPGLGAFDAAQSQYDDDDGDSNNRSDDDDEGDGDGPPPLILGERTDCGIFRQNFGGDPAEMNACAVATQQVLSGAAIPAQACAGFDRTRPSGFRRSDYDACLLAMQLSQAALQKFLPPVALTV